MGLLEEKESSGTFDALLRCAQVARGELQSLLTEVH